MKLRYLINENHPSTMTSCRDRKPQECLVGYQQGMGPSMDGRITEVRGHLTDNIRAHVSRSDDPLISHAEVCQTLRE